jgi:nitroimidazol reductase NimA-like FMN-containing flavoprotein (pyridoxamine 5'-phosphate oxidase superfamily)
MYLPQDLPYATCRELLAAGSVGRVGVCTPGGPRILPVNYVVIGDSIVFRTLPNSILGTYAWGSALAFEVDHVDYENERGWSVLAVGRGHRVDDSQELPAFRLMWEPRPWASGSRHLLVRLDWEELTGRRLGPEGPPARGQQG